ncbi:sequence-specific single-stranded DNA-binding protein isoform X6 [Arctopsyche grandis]|uniref:sequence-specific single-stranded DNA-binding protein isoform X6 n=1 Tax=Arctopsyche grandis TaxID=121162 RepID=UPI00406D79FD
MYAKGKGSAVPSDAQAREKLALYVYEYLLHVGAQKAAQTFLSEIRWEKNITLGEPPGFLHSWWCVFWDLYCAAPERRDTCEHSSEAKAFHDYGFVNSGYGVNGIGHAAPHAGPAPPNDGMGGGGMPPGFFPNSPLRPSPPAHGPAPGQPSPQLLGGPQPFMGPWYPPGPGPRPSVRMPMPNDFNGPPGQPMMGNSMERGGPPGMMNPRMNPPRGPGMGPMSPGGYGPAMRGPPPQGMPPGMGMTPRAAWQGGAGGSINYSSSSPGTYGGPPGSNGPPGPGTPIMPSPQDSSNSGGEGMYTLMKPVGGAGGLGAEFPLGGADHAPPPPSQEGQQEINAWEEWTE